MGIITNEWSYSTNKQGSRNYLNLITYNTLKYLCYRFIQQGTLTKLASGGNRPHALTINRACETLTEQRETSASGQFPEEQRASVQLDWPLIADWAYTSIFTVEVQFQIRDQFWIPQPELLTRGMYFGFLKNREMSLFGRFWCFWQFQQKLDGSPIIAARQRIRVSRA